MCLSAEAMGLGRPASTCLEELPGFVVYPPGDVVAMTSCLSGFLRRTEMLRGLPSSLSPPEPPAGYRTPRSCGVPQHT